MAHFCGFTKLIFLLLMLARIPFNETRPLKGNSQSTSDLIAGNEFLKLFLEHDQLDKDYFNSDYGAGGGGNGQGIQTEFDKKSAETGRRASGGRSLKDKGPKQNQAEGQPENSKQVVKLVTSGSKIVFLEDYDENDAILDAEARDIDLKREIFKQKAHHHHHDSKSNLDDFKVVAVSVSSSSHRGTTNSRNRMATTTTTTTTRKTTTTTTSKPTTRYNKSYTTSKMIVTMTPKPPTASTTTNNMTTQQKSSTPTRSDSVVGDNFINRSHKSELSIEEVEPLTMTQPHKSRKHFARHRTFPLTSVADTLEALDSENSASTNINNVLAAPLAQAASARSTSTVTSTYHSSQRNVSINHDSNHDLHNSQTHKTHVDDNSDRIEMPSTSSQEQTQQANGSGGVAPEDQLLPFQTVIYHDTKAGHGPQSRSISYSSISQNVEDLKKWQQSGILAEARRNVSESLKPKTHPTAIPSNHQPEPAKFYSQPSKMYSEPSKFYSEPSKVYSEPSKIYGEPEKFYSEPAKNYGQPSKVYSEPSKVYSQPSKVYSEPAKTYWPLLTTTLPSDTFITTTIIPPANSPSITTILPPANNIYQSSRRPAIVSRIAFGENHSTSTTTTTSTTPPPQTTSKSYGSHIQHNHSRTYGHHRHLPSTYSSSSLTADSANNENASSSTPSRRIIFNLDRLPYDLLNAPEPSNLQQQQQPLLEHEKLKRPHQKLTYQPQQQHHHHINPCLESAVTSLFSSSTLSAHPALQKQRQQQQHSSLSDQQHSNQNAKGLPNGDLVKCVAEISHTSSSSAAAAATNGEDDDEDTGEVESFTTERSHTEELFSATPEQNYKIEESAMTNGRADGGISGGGRNSLALPTTSSIHQQQHHGFKPNRQRTRTHFATNINNNPTDIVNGDDRGGTGGVHGGHQFSQSSYNTNANANVQNNNSNNRNTNVANTNPDYNNYDDDGNNDDGGNGGNDYDGSSKNNDYENDDENNNNKNIPHQSNTADGRGPLPNNNGDDEDSKVAYVVDGRNYRKYRVEEKTDDGFIVGEYGVVDHNDGNLRGVRYTADSTINRSLIHKTLLTFLNLK